MRAETYRSPRPDAITTPKLAELVYQDTMLSQGSSRSITAGSTPIPVGYMVSIEGFELRLPWSAFTVSAVRDYISREALRAIKMYTDDVGDFYIGTWMTDIGEFEPLTYGTVVLDMSLQVPLLSDALSMARAHKQEAIFDLVARGSVQVREGK